MRKVEILILGEEDLINNDIEVVNIDNIKNLDFMTLCNENVIMFNDKFGKTTVLKNRWGSNGIVN